MRLPVLMCQAILEDVSDGQNTISRRSWDTSASHRLEEGNAALFPQVCVEFLDVVVKLFYAIASGVVPGNT